LPRTNGAEDPLGTGPAQVDHGRFRKQYQDTEDSDMPIQARYAHTNMIVNDLEKMVAFYRDVFGFTDAEPERWQSAPALAKLTGIPGAAIRVQHLRYPGDTGGQGPTLEIICYRDTQQLPHDKPAANRPGFRHLCFNVDDVDAAFAAVIAAGGGSLGEVVRTENPRAFNHIVYATDPEGNILELLNKTLKPQA